MIAHSCAAARHQGQAAILPLDPLRVARRCFIAAGLNGMDLALALCEFQEALVTTFGKFAEGSRFRREAVFPRAGITRPDGTSARRETRFALLKENYHEAS